MGLFSRKRKPDLAAANEPYTQDLTLAKIKIYKKYGGDADHWARVNGEAEKGIIKYEDFQIIEQLISDIIMLNSGYAGQTIKDKHEQTLKELNATEEVRALLQKLTKK